MNLVWNYRTKRPWEFSSESSKNLQISLDRNNYLKGKFKVSRELKEQMILQALKHRPQLQLQSKIKAQLN
jgi:hypothetical protein